MPFEFGDEPFDSSSTVSINCVVSKGDTPIMIEWLLNGNRVTTNDGINIMKSGQKISMLSIESVQSRHAGNYTCVARNKAGESQHTSELKVIGNVKEFGHILLPKIPSLFKNFVGFRLLGPSEICSDIRLCRPEIFS